MKYTFIITLDGPDLDDQKELIKEEIRAFSEEIVYELVDRLADATIEEKEEE